jgi:trimethylamine:corrinoid methyltransferase-like protein
VFYGMHGVGTRSIRSMAKRPGIQGAAEKAASAVVGALAGSRSFFGAGTLSVDEVWSDEQLVIDREIADYALRVAQGFEFDAEALAVEIIEECVASGEFLAHPSTVRSHRSTYWQPSLLEHTSLHRWQQSGEPSVEAAAHHMVNEKLARFDFEHSARASCTIYDRRNLEVGP